MRPDPVHAAIACLVLALAGVVLAGRLGADGGPTPHQPTQGWDLCAGFATKDGPILGVASGRTDAHLLARAIALLGLPGSCATLELPAEATRGGLIRYLKRRRREMSPYTQVVFQELEQLGNDLRQFTDGPDREHSDIWVPGEPVN